MKLFLLITLVSIAFTASGQTKLQGKNKINGTDLYLNVKGKGEYLLVLHGGPGLNHSYFTPHLRDLEKKFTLIYFDQRACGKSAIPASDSISIKFLVGDIDAIRKKFKIEKLNILAHSWGALQAVQYSMAHSENVNKLILSNPSMLSREYDGQAAQLVRKNTASGDSIKQANIMSQGEMDSKKYEEMLLLSFKPSAFKKENVSKINLNLPKNFAAANNALFTALMKDPSLGQNLYESLSELDFPVLIIHGDADVIPLESIERLNKELPQSELVVFKESGHFPFVEETALFNARVVEFLEKK
jgi:proline iminopeptidase